MVVSLLVLVNLSTEGIEYVIMQHIIIAAAKNGFQADGVELNPWLVQYSRLAALKNGVSSKTAFYRRDLWTYNLAPYQNIVIFGVEQMASTNVYFKILVLILQKRL